MRINGVILCVLAVFGSIFLVCSRSDVISGVAEDVVKDMDNTLTDTLIRFVRIDLDSSDVESYSLPNAANPAFSTTFADSSVIVGVNGETDIMAAYIQYRVAADTARYKSRDSLNLERVYLYFPADTAATDASDSISVSLYWVKTLAASAPVDTGDGGRHPDAGKDTFTTACPPDDNAAGNNGGGECESVVWPLKFTLSGGNKADSANFVTLPDSIAGSIFGRRASKTVSSGTVFAFNLAAADGEKNVRRIRNPYMVIVTSKNAEKTDNAQKVRDTIIDTIRTESSRYTVFENADSAAARAKKAYSSQRAMRTAVFEISLKKIKDRLGKGEYTNLNAVITLKPGSNPDKSGSNGDNYRIFVSDTLFKTSDTAVLNEKFGGKGSASRRPVIPYSTLSITATQSINPSLQSVLERNNEYLYVYLRADSDDSAIIWDEPEPIRLETVFTPSR